MLRTPSLTVEVVLTTIGCAGKDCVRVILPAEVVMMRKIEGTACSEPLCPVCAAAALEDAKLAVRMFLHREEQRAATERMLEDEPSPATQPMPTGL